MMMSRTLLLFCLLVGGNAGYGQTFLVPDCRHLEVTALQFTADSSVQVTVSNNCSECARHVYTGIVIHGTSGDTLAAHKYLFAWANPPNLEATTYPVKATLPFTLADISRIEMTAGICGDIPFSSSLIAELTNPALIQIAPNPANGNVRIITPPGTEISRTTLLDGAGRIIRHITARPTTFSTTGLAAGTYLLRLTTNHSTITKRLVVGN